MTHYTSITIIYNPNSTGSSQKIAKQTAARLKTLIPNGRIKTVGTEYPGHAEVLAYDLAKASSRPLIISASGDGGYNEVINGALRAKQEGTTPTTGLLPGGNANDHFNALHTTDFAEAVATGKERTIDVLKLSARSADGSFTRYAHSYIGLGLSSEIGHELNKTQLNSLKEAWIAGTSFLRFEHVKIRLRGKTLKYHSLVFSNIHRMAKILTLSKNAKPDDGIFEVGALPYTSKFNSVFSLLKASAQGEFSTTRVRTYSFQTVQRTRIQLDGEIITLAPRTDVSVGLEHKALTCIV